MKTCLLWLLTVSAIATATVCTTNTIIAHAQQAPQATASPAKPPTITSGASQIFTTSAISMPEPVATMSGPALKDGYLVYTMRVKVGWACAWSSNYVPSSNPLRFNPPTLITLTCVAGEPSKP